MSRIVVKGLREAPSAQYCPCGCGKPWFCRMYYREASIWVGNDENPFDELSEPELWRDWEDLYDYDDVF